jgi:uncharacterized protein
MAEYKTPGVYVEEISTFPASVVRVATAVPVFIGYTEFAGADVLNVPVKVKSLVEYQQLFGGEPSDPLDRMINVSVNNTGGVIAASVALRFYLYQCLRHFYANGGGDVYILSVGAYSNANEATRMAAIIAALTVLERADEPTLILTPDAFAFASAANLGTVQAKVLEHCAKMQDRFGILDVQAGVDALASASTFRGAVGQQNLKYGAAYFPPLASSLGPDGPVGLGSISLKNAAGAAITLADLATASSDPVITALSATPSDRSRLPSRGTLNGYVASYNAIAETANKAELIARADLIDQVTTVLYGLRAMTPAWQNSKIADYLSPILSNTVSPTQGFLKTKLKELYALDKGFEFSGITTPAPTTAPTALGEVLVPAYNVSPFGYAIGTPAVAALPAAYGAANRDVALQIADARSAFNAIFQAAYDWLKGVVALADQLESQLIGSSRVLADIRDAVTSAGYTLPPSGAIAGVYATVDASRGVWKAPANVSLAAVASVAKIPDDGLSNLNVDVTAGKSINAIRFFRGQGILVYGARTLAGNDNEWRYVPVRRLFIMVEESVRKASEPFVFEPNDGNTWQRIKAMIENFLLGVWRDGGLAGAVPKDAFFVKVGLGQTMTAQDILEGKLIIEIGMAAVRPAEFVILRFSHKMQES